MRMDSSIAGKITLGYYLVGLLILVLSAFTFFELRQLDQAFGSRERTVRFLTDVLEARRFEKNHLLYGREEDLEAAVRYASAAESLLAAHRGEFESVYGGAALDRAGGELTAYRTALQGLAEDALAPTQRERLQEDLRRAGRRVTDEAERMAGSEQRQLQESLARSRVLLLGGVLGLVLVGAIVGRMLSRRVVRTLQQLESSMDGVADGALGLVPIDSRDREIVSLTRAFNHVLDQLEAKHAHLVRSQKLAALGTMLSGVAHELNNPLSNISTSCQILVEEIDDPDLDYKRDLLGQIDEQVERARRIVRSLLEFARERPSRKEPLVLREVMEETLRFVRGEIPRGLELRTDIPAELRVVADKQRLQQALLNLVKNAAEAVAGRGTIDITAARAVGDWNQPRCAARKDALELRIHDSGPGIDPEILPRIFDPFFTTKEVGQGSGLGLAIVHEIVEEHDGCIAAESAPGQGTVFRLRLPLVPTEHPGDDSHA